MFAMKKTLCARGIACFASIVLAGTPATCPTVVRVGFVDSPMSPYLNGSGADFDNPPGKLVDWIRVAAKRTRCNPYLDVHRFPVGSRSRVELADGRYDIASLGAYLPENESIAAAPMHDGRVDEGLAHFYLSYSLFTRKGESEVRWDGQHMQGPAGFKMGMARALAPKLLAERMGWPVETGLGNLNVVNMLLAGRTRVAILPSYALEILPPQRRGQLEQLDPPVIGVWYYALASKPFYTRYPDFMHQFWGELCRVARPEQPGLSPCRKPG